MSMEGFGALLSDHGIDDGVCEMQEVAVDGFWQKARVSTSFAWKTAAGGRVVAVSAGGVTRSLCGMPVVAGLNRAAMGSN